MNIKIFNTTAWLGLYIGGGVHGVKIEIDFMLLGKELSIFINS